jgi:hypothetical protein
MLFVFTEQHTSYTFGHIKNFNKFKVVDLEKVENIGIYCGNVERQKRYGKH